MSCAERHVSRSSTCSEVLVFGRFGRTDAEGAFATCHCLTLPESRAGLLLLAGSHDRRADAPIRMVRHEVARGLRSAAEQIKYLISFVLPRFCDQTLERSRKADLYRPARRAGWRSSTRSCTSSITSIRTKPAFAASRAPTAPTHRARTVPVSTRRSPRWCSAYLATRSRPVAVRIPRADFAALSERYGGVVATTFRNFPSFPQRYMQALDAPPLDP